MTNKETGVYDRLRAVQNALVAPKSHYNDFGDFNYRSAEDIEAALKPLLEANGITLYISDSIEAVGNRFYIKSTATVTDGSDVVSVDGWAREVESKTKSDPAQITGMASSYARKYALGGLFLVDDQADPDSMNNTTPAKGASPTEHQGGRDALRDAQQRLWDAVKAYAEKSGDDAKKLAAGCKDRKDYQETAEWYLMVAEEFRSA